MKRALATLGLIVTLTLTVVPAQAHEGVTETFKMTYEMTSNGVFYSQHDDDTGLTSDGMIQQGGLFLSPHRGEHLHTAQFGIGDDVWGYGTVGAWVCSDEDRDRVFCEEDQGEFRDGFCGQSPEYDLGRIAEDEMVAVLLMDAADQAENCDPFAAPHPTTGGVLNPAAGILGITTGGHVAFPETVGTMPP